MTITDQPVSQEIERLTTSVFSMLVDGASRAEIAAKAAESGLPDEVRDMALRLCFQRAEQCWLLPEQKEARGKLVIRLTALAATGHSDDALTAHMRNVGLSENAFEMYLGAIPRIPASSIKRLFRRVLSVAAAVGFAFFAIGAAACVADAKWGPALVAAAISSGCWIAYRRLGGRRKVRPAV